MAHPNITKQRARIRETMKRLGLSEGKMSAASTRRRMRLPASARMPRHFEAVRWLLAAN